MKAPQDTKDCPDPPDPYTETEEGLTIVLQETRDVAKECKFKLLRLNEHIEAVQK